MDWNNVDLKENSSERESTILDAYSFEQLLLEIHCNLREINDETVTAQFMESLNSKIESAKEIFKSNLKNIVKQAKKERQD
jgi:formiminotetrahydrofolate cyclodeaminase